ncbi:MAG: hypothetical protein V9G20_13105 [Candidatus Promineifilaceae bacterium]
MRNAFYLLFLWLVLPVPTAFAQSGDDAPLTIRGDVSLTIQLRASDGKPLAGEPIILEQLPDAAAIQPACQTDQNGLCTWFVAPDLYQVQFLAYELDDISALALAEGGLSGLGITVGQAAIRYAFTVQADGHVYFDATPDAAAPTPRLPPQTGLSGGAVFSSVVDLVMQPATTATPVMLLPEPEKTAPSISWWLWLVAGVALGFMGWLGSRYRRGTFTPKATQRNKV